MSADQLLATVLRAFQGVPDVEKTGRILSTTTSLLTTLSNPRNITLLTSHLLTAPAVWLQPDGLRTCLRIMSVLNTAAIMIHKMEHEEPALDQPKLGSGISCDEWTKAVIQGADERSPRWRHLLVIGGVLIGMEGQNRGGLSYSLKNTIQSAMVKASNLALLDPANDGILGAEAIVLALTHTFELLSEGVRSSLNFDVLARIAVQSMVTTEGYQEAYFLGRIDLDVVQVSDNRFDFSSKSVTFYQLQKLSSQPLIASMGPLSRLISYSIMHSEDPATTLRVLNTLETFTRLLHQQWRQNKLSEIDASEESAFLTTESLEITVPVLWQLLKGAMFATVVILQSILDRTVTDPALSSNELVPSTAVSSLHILMYLHFISSRLGQNSFSTYRFVYLASIDMITRFPGHARSFLQSTRPAHLGSIPIHPLDRNIDLFYLNTSEHFTLILNAKDNEELISAAALPYLNPGANKNLLEIFEAAHSAILAVLAAPQNSELTARLIPFYMEVLFSSFPTNLSPRQFRFAFKTLLQITAPPNTLADSQPLLPDTLLEMLHYKALNAPTVPMPAALAVRDEADAVSQEDKPLLSEQAVLLLTLLDALPYVPTPTLEEWLPLAADLLNVIEDQGMRAVCRERFWEVLNNGEMDIDRSAVCVAWWTSRGGREYVLFGKEQKFMMSGGLGGRDGSRL